MSSGPASRAPAAPASARWCDAFLSARGCCYEEKYGKRCPRPHVSQEAKDAIVEAQRSQRQIESSEKDHDKKEKKSKR